MVGTYRFATAPVGRISYPPLSLRTCKMADKKSALRACAVVAGVFLCFSGHARGDAASVSTRAVGADTGAEIYQHVCQGCHMPGGRGAAGAGAFPALANNPKLEVSGYPVSMVLNGNGGMPWFNGTLSDQQVANVVNYVRTHFGNDYKDAVSPADVAAVRGPVPTLER
jgi:mono/diheme cytochrome c family protein